MGNLFVFPYKTVIILELHFSLFPSVPVFIYSSIHPSSPSTEEVPAQLIAPSGPHFMINKAVENGDLLNNEKEEPQAVINAWNAQEESDN